MPTLAVNKKAKLDYEFLQEFEGGLILTGAEVKAAKAGHIQLKGSFLGIRDGELWVRNMHISKYKKAGLQETYDPTRPRKVLAHRAEIKKIIEKQQSEGLTIVPVSVYTKGDLVKLSFALARGKKKYEKREDLKNRAIDRKIQDEMKKRRFGS